jgi:dienelactone hydrolase
VRISWIVLLLALELPTQALGRQDEKIQKGSAPCRSLRPSRDPALQALLDRYEFKEKEFTWQLKELRQTDKYTLSWLTFPSAVHTESEENNTVWARFWEPRGAGRKRPAALLLHWLGGKFELFELIGQRLAEHGIPALMMYMPDYGPRAAKDPERRDKLMKREMEQVLGNIRQAVMDARRAGDWLASRPDVEPSRVGIVGVSLGAVIGSLVAGVDDRFGRSVFIIGGGDLPTIILHGSKETIAAKKKLEEAGLTVEKMRELWRDIEPCTFASRMRPEEILMVNAETDEVIPKESTLRLYESAGRPEIRWFKGGHYALLFQVGTALKEILAHLGQRTAYARLEPPVLEEAGR